VLLEQQRRGLEDRGEQVEPDDGRSLGAAAQPPRRERQQEVAGDRGEQRVERDAGRVQGVVVGRPQAAGEPREADRRHQRAGPVRRPPPPREQPGEDERPPDQQRERGLEPAVVDVVAARDHRGDGDPAAQPGGRERDDR
jgi:hypothetical protein